MKIKQIAIRVPDINEAKLILAKLFNSNFLIDDNLKMDGNFGDENIAGVNLDLSFDYEVLNGADELELIHTDSEDHWHSKLGRGFLSHFGVYCESKSEFDSACSCLDGMNFKKIQDSISYDHSRSNSDGTERSYFDIIYNTQDKLGFNIKLTLKDIEDASF